MVIEFQYWRVADHSTTDTLAERYIKAGKILHLHHLSYDCRHLLKKTSDLVEANVYEDPLSYVVNNQIAK